MKLRSPELVEGRIACHGEAERRSRADCRGTGVSLGALTGPPASRRAVSALLLTARTTGETPAGPAWPAGRLMGGTPMPRCRAAASMEMRSRLAGTALARPRTPKAKAASRPPHSIWWLTLILTAILLPSPACAQSQPAKSKTTQTKPVDIPVPITFARSGQEIEVEILPPFVFLPPSEKAVVLTAFGRTWTKPSDVVQTSAWSRAKIVMPQVRVTTVFSVVNHSKEVVGEVVAYPDRDVQWDKKITLYSYAAATWFSQWAAATGLPVRQVPDAGFATAGLAPADEGGKSLLILGPGASGNDLSYVAKLASDKKVNVLVLESGWFGDVAGPVSVAPPQMLGGLAEIAKQRWPQPLKFATRRRPWPGIANRWAWIVDANGLPLVEQIRTVDWPVGLGHGKHFPAAGNELRFTVSYMPWQEQLGRRDQADEMLLALLLAAANRPEGQRWYMPGILHPKIDADTGKDRPVLARVMPGLERPWNHTELVSGVAIIDLRGKDSPPNDLLAECKKRQAVLERTSRPLLLILGDDKMLDEWEWLKLDRTKKTINRSGVVWLSDDELPPSKDNQIKLMLKLTELGVPLAPPGQQEEKKQ